MLTDSMNGRRTRRLARGALAGIVCLTAMIPALGVAASGERAGPVAIVDATAARRSLSSGDSTTVFSLLLPSGASCPGDSANDDWRVQSFVVPAGVDPATLRYRGVKPEGEGRFTLHLPDTAAFVHVLTGPNPRPGEPGLILALPAFTFRMFPPGTLPTGDYRIGIACTRFGETARYWDTTISVTADPSVQPGEFRWAVADPVGGAILRGPGAERSGGSGQLAIVFVLVASLAVVYVLLRRRRVEHAPDRPDRSLVVSERR